MSTGHDELITGLVFAIAQRWREDHAGAIEAMRVMPVPDAHMGPSIRLEVYPKVGEPQRITWSRTCVKNEGDKFAALVERQLQSISERWEGSDES